MKAKLLTVLYMIVIAGVFTAGVAALNHVTRGRVEFNRGLARKRAILGALRLEPPPAASPADLAAFYEQRVRAVSCRTARGQEEVYVGLGADGAPLGVAFEVSGRGMWDEVRGFLALSPDLREARGLAFFRQSETPGLGAEIAKPWFGAQFAGKQIPAAPDGQGRFLRLQPPGTALGEHDVQAVTGATGTSKAVSRFLNGDLARFLSPDVQAQLRSALADAGAVTTADTDAGGR